MIGRYFRDMSIVRADNGDRTVPIPEENEVVIYQSFFKAGLWFPLRACSVIFNPYGSEGIDTDWRGF
jgi:hypothetical protein